MLKRELSLYFIIHFFERTKLIPSIFFEKRHNINFYFSFNYFLMVTRMYVPLELLNNGFKEAEVFFLFNVLIIIYIEVELLQIAEILSEDDLVSP